MNIAGVLFTGRVNIGQHDVVRRRKRIDKIRKKAFGAAVGMRLEHDIKLLVGNLRSGLQRSADFRRVMCIIVDDHNIADRALVFKPFFGAAIVGQAFADGFKRNVIRQRRAGRAQRVINQMMAGNIEIQRA